MEILRNIAQDVLLIGGALCVIILFFVMVIGILIMIKVLKISNKADIIMTSVKDVLENLTRPIKLINATIGGIFSHNKPKNEVNRKK